MKIIRANEEAFKEIAKILNTIRMQFGTKKFLKYDLRKILDEKKCSYVTRIPEYLIINEIVDVNGDYLSFKKDIPIHYTQLTKLPDLYKHYRDLYKNKNKENISISINSKDELHEKLRKTEEKIEIISELLEKKVEYQTILKLELLK